MRSFLRPSKEGAPRKVLSEEMVEMTGAGWGGSGMDRTDSVQDRDSKLTENLWLTLCYLPQWLTRIRFMESALQPPQRRFPTLHCFQWTKVKPENFSEETEVRGGVGVLKAPAQHSIYWTELRPLRTWKPGRTKDKPGKCFWVKCQAQIQKCIEWTTKCTGNFAFSRYSTVSPSWGQITFLGS